MKATVVLLLVACGSGSGNTNCTTDPNRSAIPCTPTTGLGCVGSDLGYADDRTYGASCEAPRHDDGSSCATLYDCDTSGATPKWQPVVGF